MLIAAFITGLTFDVVGNTNTSTLDTPEIGSVAWQRDWGKASEVAQQTHKPRLVLFQEVPG